MNTFDYICLKIFRNYLNQRKALISQIDLIDCKQQQNFLKQLFTTPINPNVMATFLE